MFPWFFISGLENIRCCYSGGIIAFDCEGGATRLEKNLQACSHRGLILLGLGGIAQHLSSGQFCYYSDRVFQDRAKRRYSIFLCSYEINSVNLDREKLAFNLLLQTYCSKDSTFLVVSTLEDF